MEDYSKLTGVALMSEFKIKLFIPLFAILLFCGCGKDPALAILNGNTAQLDELLKTGYNPNKPDKYGEPLLFLAISSDNLPAVKSLVRYGADINATSAIGSHSKPIHRAAFMGNLEILKYLINNGAMVDVCNSNGDTPLFCAIANNKISIMGLLINHGADVNRVNRQGETPLTYAILEHNNDMINHLVKHGADLNKCSPFVYAAIVNNLGAIKILAELGAEIEQKDKDGRTALENAKLRNYTDIVKYLSGK